MKALATAFTSSLYSLYVQFTQTSFRLTARAMPSGTLSAVLFNIVHTEMGFSAHLGSLSLYLISTLPSG